MKNYKEMSPPFSHLGFYYSEFSEAEAFYKIYSLLLSRGASPTGKLLIEHSNKIDDEPFTHKVGWSVPKAKFVQTDEPETFLKDPNIRVHCCYLLDAVGTRDNTEEMLTLVNISKVAAQSDHYPIELVVDGSMHFPVEYMTPEELNLARLAGIREYQTFIDIVEATKPKYATLTTEESIQSPTDLKQNTLLRFQNFYISAKYFLNEKEKQSILDLYEGAYIQAMSEGLYISTWRFLNPAHLDWTQNATKRKRANSEIVKLITRSDSVS